MSASLIRHNKSAIWSASMLSALLRHLLALCISSIRCLALFSARGEEPGTRVSTHARDTESKLFARPCDFTRAGLQEVRAREFHRQGISGIKARRIGKERCKANVK